MNRHTGHHDDDMGVVSERMEANKVEVRQACTLVSQTSTTWALKGLYGPYTLTRGSSIIEYI